MRHICLFAIVLGLFHITSGASDCLSSGRFPNNDEANCRGFTMCIPTGSTFMQYKLTCPLGSVYSSIEQQCTTAPAYKCLPDYPCTSAGDFEDATTENCTSYVTCVTGLGELVSARRVRCTEHQVFSPGLGCVNETEYICGPETTTVLVTVDTTVQATEMPVTMTTLADTTAVSDVNSQFSKEAPLNSAAGVHLNVLIYLMSVCFLIKSI